MCSGRCGLGRLCVGTDADRLGWGHTSQGGASSWRPATLGTDLATVDVSSLRALSSAKPPTGPSPSVDLHNPDGSADALVPEEVSDIPEYLMALYQDCCTQIECPEIRQRLKQFLVIHQEAFAKDKNDFSLCTLVKHRIDTRSAVPVRQPCRRTPRSFEGEEREYPHQQIKAGVLVPSQSPLASPVVLVRKADATVRWCGDFRRVNDLTRKDAYPLPRIDSCHERLGSARLFTVCDLQSGYF